MSVEMTSPGSVTQLHLSAASTAAGLSAVFTATVLLAAVLFHGESEAGEEQHSMQCSTSGGQVETRYDGSVSAMSAPFIDLGKLG
jgi:hypothetical protein